MKSITESIKLVPKRHEEDELFDVKDWGYENAQKVRAFHRSFPEYEPTPLVNLENLASDLGIKALYVKDESYRFGLNAFKVLGGSYAIGNYIAQQMNKKIAELPYELMMSDEVREKIKDITFVTATDGNHGRGVAWTANRLGAPCVVYMPKGSAAERLANIQSLGAQASITDLNYDDAVRLANQGVEEHGWVLVQDTAWEGYEDIPKWIMQGYTTMALEAAEQLGDVKPTHIFLQAGVGALAGGVTAFFADYYGEDRPLITIVEPDKADCLYRTVRADDGELHFVTGDMDSEMAGLCCGEPCTIGWNILKDYADRFVSVPDAVTELGMQRLGRPIGDDTKIISGESGAVTTGLVCLAMKDDNRRWLRESLRLNKDSVVLCFSTEGDTDRENYRRILAESDTDCWNYRRIPAEAEIDRENSRGTTKNAVE